ncbi:MAG: toll/interleukin-1 receptor domain-containing protein [Chloroflexi bacterium]|nr:toll/interleukin-1 receptor domain-containing protein [Chloroflexota bacterium]
MANPEHLAILKQGVEAWNEWRKKNHHKAIDLSGAVLAGVKMGMANFGGFDRDSGMLESNLRNVDLQKSELWGADFSSALLENADLSDANLMGADCFAADLRKAQLIRTDFRAADLSLADLSHANLSDADLRGADFTRADLTGAEFSRTRIGHTRFGDIDLSVAKGLDSVIHEAPSTIGIDAIFRSQGNIPEVFLRGCGVPETFITYARSLVGQPIEFYSCFISHSAKDKQFAERLYADLQAKNVRTWYFPEDAKWGEPVWGEIDRSIRIYDKLIVVCSENSLQSGPVLREIERALNREDKEGKNILFPIRIDDYIFEKWEHPRKSDVVAKVVGDFSEWSSSASKYDEAFGKLLKALKAEYNLHR